MILTCLDPCRKIIRMSATQTENPRISFESLPIKPPSHPTYDLWGVIKSAIAEDAGDRGLNFFLVSKNLFQVVLVLRSNCSVQFSNGECKISFTFERYYLARLLFRL